MVFQRGVKLDFRHFPDGYVATAKDVEDELGPHRSYTRTARLVLVNTAAGGAVGKPDYVTRLRHGL